MVSSKLWGVMLLVAVVVDGLVVVDWVARLTVVSRDVVDLFVVNWLVVLRIVGVLWLVMCDVSEVSGVDGQLLVVNVLVGVVGAHMRIIWIDEVLVAVFMSAWDVMVISVGVVNGDNFWLLLFLLCRSLGFGSSWLRGGSWGSIIVVVEGMAAFRE